MNDFQLEFRKLGFIAFLCVIGYSFSLNGDFVFDDSEAILGNDALKDNTSIIKIFSLDFWGKDIADKTSHKSYRPLTILTFKLHKYVDGDLVAYNYKFTNLVLHVICCCLVYITFKKCFIEQKVHEIDDHASIEKKIHIPNRISFFNKEFIAAMLFAVHPIHVESVSGVVGRADVLSGIFFFLTIMFYHKDIKLKQNKSLHFLPSLTALITALASFLCKETGITVLVVCAAYEIIIINKYEALHVLDTIKYIILKHSDNKPKYFLKSYNRNIFYNLMILATVTIIFLYSRWAIMGYVGPTFQDSDNPAAFHEQIHTRILSYNYIYFLNFLLLVWPQWLCFDWSMGCVPLITDITDYRVAFVLIFNSSLGILCYAILNRKVKGSTRRALSMAMVLMIIPFLPASNIIMPVGFVVAERILYIPSAGFCMLIAIGYKSLQSYSEHFRKIMPVLLFILLTSFAMKTFHRAREWRTEYTLFNSGLQVCPLNAKVHYNVAKNAVDRKDLTFAKDHYTEAIRLNPKYYHAMNNLANLLKDQKQYDEAERLLNAALALKEDFSSAWNNLGIVLSNLNRFEEAELCYRNALKYKKNYADCYYNLGNLYLDQNLHTMAIEGWLNATKLNPKHVSAWNNILALLDNTGQINRALELAVTITRQLPDAASIHFNLGNLYGKNGNLDRAEHHFSLALQFTAPNVPAIYYINFGVLYHRDKKYDKAREMYEKALDVDPSSDTAKRNLRNVEERLLGL